ncbi:MAG: FAD-dependent oxidoreductase [Campylobacterota bacterium]|nr:FAD-dependent oxidoreductase [Campylobacterota bacterium]
MYSVIIIGGGAAGYGTALTLTSVEDKFEWAKDKKYLMIDDNNSDILKASFFNLTGVDFGIGGDKLLSNMEKQLKNFNSCDTVNSTVIKIEKLNETYKVITKDTTYISKIVVIATGMHKFDIECDDVEVLPHNNIMKPNKICLKNQNNKIKDGLYVVGLASGAKTMFAIANGEGTKVACDIFKLWTSKPAVAHDSIKDAKI